MYRRYIFINFHFENYLLVAAVVTGKTYAVHSSGKLVDNAEYNLMKNNFHRLLLLPGLIFFIFLIPLLITDRKLNTMRKKSIEFVRTGRWNILCFVNYHNQVSQPFATFFSNRLEGFKIQMFNTYTTVDVPKTVYMTRKIYVSTR